MSEPLYQWKHGREDDVFVGTFNKIDVWYEPPQPDSERGVSLFAVKGHWKPEDDELSNANRSQSFCRIHKTIPGVELSHYDMINAFDITYQEAQDLVEYANNAITMML